MIPTAGGDPNLHAQQFGDLNLGIRSAAADLLPLDPNV